MDIRPIRTKADHARALARIDEIMDARPGTPAGDELDVLVTLVEAYEEKHFPIADPEPLAVVDGLEEARRAVPGGCVCIERAPCDDPVIAEVWI